MENFKALSRQNKNLIVQSQVVLTPTIDKVIFDLDKYFVGNTSYVTSGLRDENDQLRVIRNYLVKKSLDKKHALAMTCGVYDKGKDLLYENGNVEIYAWQLAWSNLLNVGVIINPPIAAKCLMDYFVNGKNKKGQIINQTPHATGKAFNIGGGTNGPSDELQRIQKGIVDGVKGISSYLLERENNALHINCK